jgi:hypothetical protein
MGHNSVTLRLISAASDSVVKQKRKISGGFTLRLDEGAGESLASRARLCEEFVSGRRNMGV